jgi:hypothetical protein
MNPTAALPPGILFVQPLTPVADSLLLSFVVAVIPIAVALIALGVLRRPAWQASLAGLVAGLAVAIGAWGMPAGLAFNAVGAGMALAVVPVMWIVFNALLLYNIAVKSGRFDQFRQWMLDNLPDDRRLVLLVVAFSFGCLLEGISGFGTPVAITSALLIALGFPALEALTYTLVFNTAPVAFGALGVPITVLGAVTSLPPATLGAMVGRQLPFFALLLPFYVVGAYGGLRSIAKLWPALLVSGGSFAIAQFVTSNFLGYQLTDVLSSLTSLIVTIGFLQLWKPQPDPQYALARSVPATAGAARGLRRLAAVARRVGGRDLLGAREHRGDRRRQDQVAGVAQRRVRIAVPQAVCGDLGLPAARYGHRDPGVGDHHGTAHAHGHRRVLRMRGQDLATDMDRDRHRDDDRRARVPAELLGHQLHARYRRRVDRRAVSARVGVARLDRGVPVGQRHVRQRAVRQSAGRCGPATRPRSGADGRDQLVGRRDGEDDLAAEHRDGRVDDRPERAGGRSVCAHLLAQRDPHAAARRARVPAAARADVDDSGVAEVGGGRRWREQTFGRRRRVRGWGVCCRDIDERDRDVERRRLCVAVVGMHESFPSHRGLHHGAVGSVNVRGAGASVHRSNMAATIASGASS